MSDAVSDGPAAAVEDVLSAPAVVPEPLANTSPQPHQSPSMREHKDTGQDTLQFAELSGTLVNTACVFQCNCTCMLRGETLFGPVMYGVLVLTCLLC